MINIALLGAGRIGAMHAANLTAHPRYQLARVFDPDTRRAREVAESAGAATATDADEIFADGNLQAVLIASLTETHCDYMERAAAAGRAILCEKPVGLDIARVLECRGKLEALPTVPLQIGFNRRFDPGHAAVCNRVRGGEIGKLEKLVISSRDPGMPPKEYLQHAGGLFRDMMIHDFDLARAALTDAAGATDEPMRVFAAGAALIDPQLCFAANDIDTAMVIMQTASGALVHINCSRRAVYGYDQRLEAFGAEGMLLSDNVTATRVKKSGAGESEAQDPLLHFFIERYADAYRLQLDAFADAVAAGAAASPDFDDGVRALLLANAAEEAMKKGGWVEVDYDGVARA